MNVILNLHGWRKQVSISTEDYKRGCCIYKLYPPLNATIQVPISQEYVEIEFIKTNEKNSWLEVWGYKGNKDE